MIKSSKIYCPLVCGLYFFEEHTLRKHMKEDCEKFLIYKDEFDLCEKDSHVLVKKKSKKEHCEYCKKLFEDIRVEISKENMMEPYYVNDMSVLDKTKETGSNKIFIPISSYNFDLNDTMIVNCQIENESLDKNSHNLQIEDNSFYFKQKNKKSENHLYSTERVTKNTQNIDQSFLLNNNSYLIPSNNIKFFQQSEIITEEEIKDENNLTENKNLEDGFYEKFQDYFYQ